MKPTLFTLIALFFSVPISAQNITGKVTDSENNPIEFANVALYSLPDSMLITGTTTNKQGEFLLTPNGTKNAFLKISFIGCETQIVSAISGQNIVLKEDSKLLSEVVVKGNLPRFEIKNDALVSTVQNTVLSKAGTGNDVLKRLPLLTGDNGVFSVFGKGQAKIYINNREMRDVSELDNLNSADIKNVEIVTNPGARYDATVKAVIRVNTVRKAGDGFSFDIYSRYGQSKFVDIAEQLNVNYRKKGWDIFGTFAYYQNKGFQNSEIRQKTYVDTLWTQANTFYWERGSNLIMGVAGVNYEITPKHLTGAKYTTTIVPRDSSMSTSNNTILANGELYDNWKVDEYSWRKQKPTHWINAYYNGVFGNLKIDFNTDFYQYQEKTITNTTEISQEYDNRIVNSVYAIYNRLIAEKLILSYPVWNGELSLGNEISNTRRKDNYLNKQEIVPSTFTRVNNQNISFFAEYSKSISKVQVGAGLRYENVCSEYFINDVLQKKQSRRYNQWFPNFSLSTQLKDVSLQLSYTVKTRRPSYRQLSNNVHYMNRFTVFSGNPFLKPTTIHDVTFVGRWKDLRLLVSYKNEKDAVVYWAEQMKDNPAISFTTYRNLEQIPSLNTFVTYSPKVGIWSPYVSVGLLKQWLNTTCDNKLISLNKPIAVATFNNSFSLPKDFTLNLDMRYQSKGNSQVHYVTNDFLVVNIGATKSFFNNKLTVSVKGSDLFYQSQDGHITYYPAQEYYQYNRYGSRKFELTVRYKFNTARSKYKGTGAGSSERNRL